MTSGNGKELRAYSATGPLFKAWDACELMADARDRAEVQRRVLTIPASAIADKMVDEASIRAEARRRAMAYLDGTDRLNWMDWLRAGILFGMIIVLWTLVLIPFIGFWRK